MRARLCIACLVVIANVLRSAPAVFGAGASNTFGCLVLNGQANTAIIIPNSTYPVVPYAATELQYHIQRATGVTLSICTESNKPAGYPGLIYLGNCTATQQAGITLTNVGANGFVEVSSETALYIRGDDSDGAVLGSLGANRTHVGTLFGVYDFLESQMGVRWLWPGASGEVIPQASSIPLTAVSKTATPQLQHSRIRDGNWQDSVGWSSTAACAAFQTDQQKWLRRQRFALGINLDYPESFTDWWSRFGTSHPEYFNLLPDGTRRPDPTYYGSDPTLVAMSISAPGLWAQKVADWQATRTADKPWVNCMANDTNEKCTCPTCMAWDVRDPSMSDTDWNNRLTNATRDFNAGLRGWEARLGSMSDRVARYLLAVQQQAQAVDPQATVIDYAYANYSKAPLQAQLNNNVVIAIVPAMMFPWTDGKRQAFKDQWDGWHGAGARVYLRPNYFLDGANMPVYFADKFGDDFTYAYQRGMFGTDFDSLTGQWAAQSPNLYMLGRKNVDGNRTSSAILNEYYACFGPAAAAVANYWNYLESVSDNVTDSQYQSAGGHWGNWFYAARAFFTPTVMANARSYMNQALAAAGDNETAHEKVAFLEKGLTHADKTLAAYDAWQQYIAGTGGSYSVWHNAMSDLDTFRAQEEANDIANMNFLRTYEVSRTLPKVSASAGAVVALHGDNTYIRPDLNNCIVASRNATGGRSLIYVLLDLQNIKYVDKILYRNRYTVATNYNARDVTICVAPNEWDPSFDPYSQSSYTTTVFSGYFSPATNAAGSLRTADITDVGRRYFLLKILSDLWGPIGDSQPYIFAGDFLVIAQTTYSLSGTVLLGDYTGDNTSVPVTVQLKKNGAVIRSDTVTLSASGRFTLTGVVAGTYDVRIQASHWLARTTTGVTVSGSTDMGTAALTNGDANGDNQVTEADLAMVVSAMDTAEASADMDGDGMVTSTDLSIVLAQMDQGGDS